MFTSFAIILATASLAAASSIPSKPPYPFPPPYSPARNDGIHLAISAASNCASPRIDFAAANVTSNINVGLKDFHHYSTIITFGDSYTTDGKHDGSTPKPAVVIPPNPEAGGRATNGLTWIENIADDFNSTLKDYAVGGAVVNVSLWPTAQAKNASDMVGQGIFLNQSNVVDPETTLYTVFFGINDWVSAHKDGNRLPEAATDLVNQIARLASPPTNARSFLITDNYGYGTEDAIGDAYKLQIFQALGAIHKNATAPFTGFGGFRFGYVDFAPLWKSILNETAPGWPAFGYTSPGSCVVNSSSTVGECADPEHTFYWIPSHPSKETHRIMGDYVEEAIYACKLY